MAVGSINLEGRKKKQANHSSSTWLPKPVASVILFVYLFYLSSFRIANILSTYLSTTQATDLYSQADAVEVAGRKKREEIFAKFEQVCETVRP